MSARRCKDCIPKTADINPIQELIKELESIQNNALVDSTRASDSLVPENNPHPAVMGTDEESIQSKLKLNSSSAKADISPFSRDLQGFSDPKETLSADGDPENDSEYELDDELEDSSAIPAFIDSGFKISHETLVNKFMTYKNHVDGNSFRST